MADINEIILRITGDDDEGQRALAQIVAALEAVDAVEAEPEVQLQGEAGVLAGLAAIMTAIQGVDQAEAKPDVEVPTAGPIAQIAILAAALESLPNEVNVDVEVDKDGAARTGSKILAGAINALSSAGAGLTQSLGQVGVSIGPFATALNPVTIAIIAMALAIGVALVAALAALASSLAIATAALAALAVALVGALAPIAAVGFPALLAFAKVLAILKREQTEAANAAIEKARADQTAIQYARQHSDAELELARAITARRDAVVQAMREMENAIEAVSDSYRSLERAQLSQEAAQLGIEQAELNLKNFRSEVGLIGTDLDSLFKKFTDVDFKGNSEAIIGELEGLTGMDIKGSRELELKQLILAVKEARLSEKEATDGVSDSERNLGRARQDALAFQKQGIEASKTYQAAIERVTQAQVQLQRIEEDRKAQLEQEGLQKSISMTEALTRREQRLLDVVKELIDAFKEAFGPAVNALLDGIIDGLKGMGGAIKRLKGNLTSLGGAMGSAVSGLLGGLATPEATELFQVLIDGATELTPLIASSFGSILDLLTKIAVAAMPYLVAGFEAIAGWLNELSANTSVQDISDVLALMMPHLEKWLELGKQLGGAFFELLIAAAPAGLQLATDIARIAGDLAKWAGSAEGRQQIKDFLDEAIPLAEDFAVAVFTVLKWFTAMVGVTNDVIDVFQLLWDLLLPFRWFLKEFWDQLKADIEAVAGWLGTASVNIENAWADVMEFLSTLPQAMFDAGADAIKGFIEGLLSIAPDLVETAKDIMNVPGAIAEQILKIGSPSKVMFDIGKNVTKGFELGIQDQASRIAQASRVTFAAPIPATAGQSQGITIQEQNVNLPAAPGHDQLGDPRVQAEMFAREMMRRGFNEVGAPS